MTTSGAQAAVTFLNSTGQTLHGVLHRPEQGAFSSAAILCHGMESSKESAKIVALAARLSASGVLALRFDFACASGSDQDFAAMTYRGEVEDLRAAFRFVLRYPVRRVGVFGSSMGGTVALLFAAQESRVAALVTLAAPLYPQKITEQILAPNAIEEWQQRGYIFYHDRKINVTLWEDLRALDVARAARDAGCPTLVIHGERDETVPITDGRELFSLLPGTKKLAVLPDMDHRVSDPNRLQEVVALASEWLTCHLQ